MHWMVHILHMHACRLARKHLYTGPKHSRPKGEGNLSSNARLLVIKCCDSVWRLIFHYLSPRTFTKRAKEKWVMLIVGGTTPCALLRTKSRVFFSFGKRKINVWFLSLFAQFNSAQFALQFFHGVSEHPQGEKSKKKKEKRQKENVYDDVLFDEICFFPHMWFCQRNQETKLT